MVEQALGVLPVTELLGRASAREVLRPGDARSGSTFERVAIDGEHYFLKRTTPSQDWIMRVTGDRVHRNYLVWAAGIMNQAPPCIDHTVVAMELTGSGDGAELAVLMRDVGACLVPEGDATVPFGQHRGFVEHLAQLCASFWECGEPVAGLATMANRLRFFAPDNIAAELAVEEVPRAIAAAGAGWRSLPDRSPQLWRVAAAVHDDPGLVADPLAATPQTFLHGDWKMGNLGTHPGGRTILLDWAYPGRGPACWDLCWYLALNCARLPETKEATIARFRDGLERLGIATSGWWETQLDLCLVGIMATFGWEKALGGDEELRWWADRVAQAAERQHLSC